MQKPFIPSSRTSLRRHGRSYLNVRLALSLAATLGLGTAAHADIFDNNSSTTGFGVTNGASYDWWTAGTWSDTATVNDGTAATVTWQGSATVSEQAFFVGSGVAGQNYTVRLGSGGSTDTYIQNLALNVNAAGSAALAGTAGNVTLGNLLDTGNLILRSANSVGAPNSGTLTVNNGVNLNAQTMNFRGGLVTINGTISGTGASNINLASGAFGLNAGTLTLAGVNSYAGTTTVASAYILKIQHANALGGTTSGTTVSSGGAVEVAGGITSNSGESISIAGPSTSNFGALRAGAGGGTWAGQVTLGDAAARIGALAAQTLTITGSIVNGVGTAVGISGESGTGVVILNPTTSNSYTGTTGIIRGILRLGKTDALPTGTTLDVDQASGVTDAATFDMASFSQTVAVLQDTAGSNINGKITNSSGSTTSTLTVNQESNTIYDGIIENGSGSVVLTKKGVGNLTLNGANTYTGGTNLESGKIIIGGAADRLATGGTVFIGSAANTGALVLGDGTNARNQTLAGLTNTGLGGAVVGNAAANSTLTLNIASGTNAFGGTLGGAGTSENNLAVTKTGAGTLNLTGANTYGGTTTLITGTLQIGVGNVGSVGAITSSAIGTGGLNFNGGTISSDSTTDRTILNAVTYSTASTFGNATNNGKLTFSAGVNLGTAQKTMTVNSAVEFSGKITGTGGGITKLGAGTLTLSGASSDYTGAVTFGTTNGTDGVLVLADSSALGTSAGVLVIRGGTQTGGVQLTGGITISDAITFEGRQTSNQGDMISNHSGNNIVAGLMTGGVQGGNYNFASQAGLIDFQGGITTAESGRQINLRGAGNGKISGAIINTGTGTIAVRLQESGIWELSAANTHVGNTTIAGAGTIKLTNNLALQNSALDTNYQGGGTVDFTGVNTPTLGGLTSAVNLVLPSNVTSLTLNVAATQTYTGILSGVSGLTLTKSGAGTQILSGTNGYTGLTTVNGGELRITTAAAIGGNSVEVLSGRLALDGGITVSGKSLTTSGNGNNFFGGLQSVSGVNTWDGSVLLGADLSRLGARKDATLLLSGAVDDGANTFTLVVRNENQNNTSGAGNATTITELSGVSTYGGNTQLIAGVTRLGAGDNRLPTATILQFGGSGANAKFDMNGRSQEVAGLAVMNSSNDTQRDWNANELTNSSGTLSTLTVNTVADQTFGLTPTSFTGSGNYSGAITGNIALVKSGASKLTLTGSHTYTGTTSVSEGVLAVNGSLANTTTTVSSATTARLQGSGLIVGPVTIGNNGTLAPGNSIESLGVGALTFDANSTFDFEFQTDLFDTTPDVAADLTYSSGTLFITPGVLITLNDPSTTTPLALGSKLTLISYKAGAAPPGVFTYGVTTLQDGDSIPLGANTWRFDYDDTTGGPNFLADANQAGADRFFTMTVVPEAGTAGLLALGLLLLRRLRRRAD